jgi:hypothetical protein
LQRRFAAQEVTAAGNAVRDDAPMRLAAAVTVAIVLGVSPALAQPSQTPPEISPSQYQPEPWPTPPVMEPRTHRYGAKVALVDGLSVGAFVVGGILFAGSAFNSGPDEEDDMILGFGLMLGGIAGYAIGGPVVHGWKGNKSGAWKSVGLRLGLPLLGVAIAEIAQTPHCEGDVCYEEDEGLGLGLAGLGMLSAMVIDWFVLAKVERREQTYVPYATTNRGGGVTLGLAGAF